jgi:hypothetical protein
MTDHERIFISYSTKDGKACADALREELKAKGFSVWQDLVALKGGQDWWSQIEAALKTKELQHFILVVTPGALASKVVRQEIRLARQEGKTVSPVRGPGFNDLNELPRWVGQVYDLNTPEKCELLKRVLEGPSYQNRVPMMAPEPPADFVQRPAEFEALKRKLLDAKGDAVAITAALRGAGGYGKTTLAKALAHDPDIADAYFDGILWAELGEKPEKLLSIVADLIEILSGGRPGLENLNSAAAKLGEALGDRRILLVIDDAWREQDLRPFLEGGRNTTRLITTRLNRIVPQRAQRQQVDAMRADEARALLSWGLPGGQVALHAQPLVDLAARLGEWAQLLKLVNGFLCDRVSECCEPLGNAIADANQRLDEEGLTTFDASNENDRTKAVAQTACSTQPSAPASRTSPSFQRTQTFPSASLRAFGGKQRALEKAEQKISFSAFSVSRFLFRSISTGAPSASTTRCGTSCESKRARTAWARCINACSKPWTGSPRMRARTKPRAAIILSTAPRI